MTDPRIDALVDIIWGRESPDRVWVDQATKIAARLDAADSAAGVVRVDLNDDALMGRLVDAIETPWSYDRESPHDTPWQVWRRRALRAALQQPEDRR
jgi:hypothetical protein